MGNSKDKPQKGIKIEVVEYTGLHSRGEIKWLQSTDCSRSE